MVNVADTLAGFFGDPVFICKPENSWRDHKDEYEGKNVAVVHQNTVSGDDGMFCRLCGDRIKEPGEA